MGRFLSILIATFISVLCALATWHYFERYLSKLEAEKVASVIDAKAEESKATTKAVVDRIRYKWKVENKTNPVTDEKVVTATRFSEDVGSAIAFRCYGIGKKTFDVMVSFPKAIDWSLYQGNYSTDIKFRVDKGDLSEIMVNRSSSSVAIPELTEVDNLEREYKAYPSLLESYRKNNASIREFKRISEATLFEASISDGTIFHQVISINLEGIKDAIKPVLSLCGKAKL